MKQIENPGKEDGRELLRSLILQLFPKATAKIPFDSRLLDLDELIEFG